MENLNETATESPPQSTKVLKTPSLGEGRGGLEKGLRGGLWEGRDGPGLHLKLTRMIANRSCTMGVLTVEGTDFQLFTREDKLPTVDDNYIKHCLRPGIYDLVIEYGPIDIGNKTVRGYWPVFRRIPWFPKASFCVASNHGCRFGRINIGTSMPDEFTLDGAEEAIKMMLRLVAYQTHQTPKTHQTHPSPPVREGEIDSAASSGSAPSGSESSGSASSGSESSDAVPSMGMASEGVTLEIVESPEMEIHDISREQYYAQLQMEQERKELEAFEREVYG